MTVIRRSKLTPQLRTLRHLSLLTSFPGSIRYIEFLLQVFSLPVLIPAWRLTNKMALLIRSQTAIDFEATTITTLESQLEESVSSYTPKNTRHHTIEIIRTSSFVLKIIHQKPVTASSSLKTKAITTSQPTHIMAEMAPPFSSASHSPPSSHRKTDSQSSQLLTVESENEEHQRGRKRRRSSNNSPPPHLTSNASTTLRGRARRRSASFTLSDSFERVRSPSPGNEKRRSPGRKYAKKEFLIMGERARRSQSLSRSRTRGQAGDGKGDREETVKPRRRQRTRSRQRKHSDRDEKENMQSGTERRDSAVEIDEVAVED